MTLQTRLFLTIGTVLAIAFLGVEVLVYHRGREASIKELLNLAEEVRNVLMATRRVYHHQFLDSGIVLTPKTLGFLPAHALSKISSDFPNWSKSGLSFNNVSDRPRNPTNAADDVEMEAIRHFQKHPKEKMRFVELYTEDGEPFLHYSRPIWIEPYCLKCHGNRAEAPPAIREVYSGSYGYKVGDLRGIMSIKIPMADLQRQIMTAFLQDSVIYLVSFFLVFIFLGLTIRRHVIRPLTRLNTAMDSVAGEGLVERLEGLDGDFAQISCTFNTMNTEIIQKRSALLDSEASLKSARDNLERQVQKRTAALTRANEELKNFAYIVSHDLRSPLVSILGLIGELRFGFDAIRSRVTPRLNDLDESDRKVLGEAMMEEIPRAMGFIESSTKKMDRLVKAILTLSRLGRRELQIGPVNVQQLVEESVQALAHNIEQAGIAVRLGELPSLVSDRLSLEQIFGNLLDNAVKYTDPDRPNLIEVTAEMKAGEVTFYIRDQGRGIAEEDIPRVFQIFQRVGRQNTEGEGMGMAFTQTLARRLGGCIRCESELGQGTAFSFTIPEESETGSNRKEVRP